MNSITIALVFLLGSAPMYNTAAESPQLSAEQAKLLESVGSAAVQYSQNLPNFICTQITHRAVTAMGSSGLGLTGISSDGPGMNIPPMSGSGPDSSDVIEERVTFVGGKEGYEVVKLNGKNVAGMAHMQFQGAISAGEFGSALHAIFDPQSRTTFTWDRKESIHGRAVGVFKFEVPKESGITVIHNETGLQIVAPYAGQIFIDIDTLEVLRINSALKLPLSFPILMIASTVEYRPVTVAGRSYNLPYHSEVRMQDRSHLYVNRIDFKDYHKFTTESTIHYGETSP